MNEIQDVKDAFGNHQWEERVKANPRRIYAFLLASDEHEGFLAYIQNAWRTLHTLSGDACDIFTFEQWVMPNDRFSGKNYVSIPTPELGGGRLISTDQLAAIERKMRDSTAPDREALQTVTSLSGDPGLHAAIDNGVRIPDRTLCYEIRDKLFKRPESIILPGLALFASPNTVDATYLECGGLSAQQLSELFQKVLNLIRFTYHSGVAGERFDIYETVTRAHSRDQLKGKIVKAVSTLTLKDLFSILTGGIGLITPKGGSDAKS